ncbi:MAG: tRNA dihydrouridine synthase DusB [Deltaproteobacteria bacterium]|nr:tRNA dihydrouridine synthase DusB [Deltaproteobacteria bacterium]
MSVYGFKLGNLNLDNPLVLAPLSGVTNLPFRLLNKRHGAGLVVTEMVSAAGLCRGAVKSIKLMESEAEERPLAVQLFGAKPGWLVRAAELVQEAGADVIDINMGCPVRKVIRHGAGAALLKDFGLIKEILTRVREVVTIPLTVKTRIGWKPGYTEIEHLAPILADCGVDGVTLHGRWASQKYSGRADWSMIARLVELFPGPVIGNGDVTSPDLAVQMLKQTGCAGVMIGRGALGNPWIFSQTLEMLENRPVAEPDYETRFQTAKAHAEMLLDYFGLPKAVYLLRSVLMWYTKGLRNSTAFRGRINQVKDFEQLMSIVEEFFIGLQTDEQPDAEAVAG